MTGSVVLLGTGLLAPAPAGASSAAPSTPLVVELDDIVPGQLPRTGRIEVTGTVTNADDDPWARINLYSFLDDDPIDDVAELEQAALVGEDLPVGDRITEEGAFDEVEELAPGESATFTVSVPSRLLLERVSAATGEPEPGVYWFGVHALGESPEGRDEFTDGRARTFLPLLPEQVRRPVPLTLVLPLRPPVSYAADGSVADPAAWAEQLGLGGDLRDRLDFAAASGSDPVSWLVDPAVVDVVTQLANGNPPRSLAPTDEVPGEEDGGEPSPAPGSGSGTTSPGEPPSDPAGDASAIPSETPGSDAEPGDVPPTTGDPVTTEAAERALAWLDRFGDGVGGDELLTLPYGDLDVAGALEHAPDTYLDARDRVSPALRALTEGAGTTAVPVVAPPDGYVSADVLAGLDDLDTGSLLLGSDEMVEGVAPSLATVADRPVVLSSTGAASGGPAPSERLSSLALRQRILSEAALRLLDADEATAVRAAAAPVDPEDLSDPEDPAGPGRDAGERVDDAAPLPTAVAPEPLVVVLPDGWAGEGGSTFFSGLRGAGVELTPLDAATDQDGVSLTPEEIAEPDAPASAGLDAAAFDAAAALRRNGATLQNLLTRNSRVGTVVAGEALTSVGYPRRDDPVGARAEARASQAWIRERLGAVSIDTPPGVTLSGATGSFSATVVNDLDEPVTVGVEAVVDGGITVTTPEPVELGPDGRTTVLIRTDDAEPGVHNVALRVVDASGRSLPAGDSVPIRSAQVSNVIWVIIATGVGLLFATILLRTVRRVVGRGRDGGAGTAPAGGTA